jgi:hypothetical protein
MSTNVKRVSTGYIPRSFQANLHRILRRFSVIAAHRRFGKSVFALNELIDRALRNQLKNPQYAYLAPTYGQAKRVAWTYLKEYTANIPGVTVNEAELRIDIERPANKDRIRIMLLGAENPDSLKGIYLDGAVLDEFGTMFPTAWTEAIRPTLSDRKGWCLFIGTPTGNNHFKSVYDYAAAGTDPDWMCATYSAADTGIIDASEMESLKRQMSEEEFNQELLCDWTAGMVGAYFAKEMSAAEKEGRITQVPIDPALPIDLYFDLGINDVTAIWFVQKHFGAWRVVDYDESADLSIPEWHKRLKKKDYNLGRLYLPHDAQVRELGTGKSRLETFQSLFGKKTVKVIPRVEDKLDSINAARLMIPKCVFDGTRCERGIKALKNYQRKWDSKQQVFSPKPLHNFASNGSDAFQQFAMAAQEDRGDVMDGKPLPREYESSGSLFTHAGGL